MISGGMQSPGTPQPLPPVMQQQAAGTETLCTGTGTCHVHTTAIGSCWLLPKQRWIWQGYQRDYSRGRVGDDARKLSSMRYKIPCFSTKPHLLSPTHPFLPYLPVQLLEAKPSRSICPSVQAADLSLWGNINTENTLTGLWYLISYSAETRCTPQSSDSILNSDPPKSPTWANLLKFHSIFITSWKTLMINWQNLYIKWKMEGKERKGT